MRFMNSIREAARNPLGIIALFISLIYGFATLLLDSSAQGLTRAERWPLIGFIVAFPVLVLIAFYKLVTKHHGKLYAPADFQADDSFLRTLSPEERESRFDTEVQEAVGTGYEETDQSNTEETEGQSGDDYRPVPDEDGSSAQTEEEQGQIESDGVPRTSEGPNVEEQTPPNSSHGREAAEPNQGGGGARSERKVSHAQRVLDTKRASVQREQAGYGSEEEGQRPRPNPYSRLNDGRAGPSRKGRSYAAMKSELRRIEETVIRDISSDLGVAPEREVAVDDTGARFDAYLGKFSEKYTFLEVKVVRSRIPSTTIVDRILYNALLADKFFGTRFRLILAIVHPFGEKERKRFESMWWKRVAKCPADIDLRFIYDEKVKDI